MTPDFRIVANGTDVTDTFRDRLEELEIVDEDGVKADRARIVVDDRDDVVALPGMDTALEISLGYRQTGLSMMGRYVVDGRGGEGPGRRLTIRATAADMKSGIRAPRTRSWENSTLSDIVRTIGGEAGLRAVVSEAIASTRWSFLAQSAESNLHFLSRIAATLNATAKPAGGALIVARRGEDRTASGDAMPDGILTLIDLVEWTWQEDGRERAGRIEALWSDVDAGRRETVSIGSGDPAVTMRHVFGSEDEARRAADGEYRRRASGEVTFSAGLARFSPNLVAGARLTLSGISSKVDGQWDVARVTHTLFDGLRTSVEAKRGGN
ncbi:MAG: phage late control D family protein [Paracoccus sp. (in: a-proteobacteria)]